MRKKKTLYTAESLFNVIMNELKSTGKVPDILEYAIPTRDKIKFRNYEFDVLGYVHYGACEGIYISLFFKGDIGNGVSDRTGTIGTIKTLDTSEEAFHKMAQLMADFQLVAMRHVESHIDDFNWTGFDIRYYKEGQTESSYGYTLHGVKTIKEAITHAKKRIPTVGEYVFADVTDNATGKTERIQLQRGEYEEDV